LVKLNCFTIGNSSYVISFLVIRVEKLSKSLTFLVIDVRFLVLVHKLGVFLTNRLREISI